MSELFQTYPVEIVEYVCSPVTGIQRVQKHPPDIADVVSAMDGRREYLRKLNDAAVTGHRGMARRETEHVSTPYVKPEYQDGHFATAWVHPHAPQFPAMVAKAQEAERIFWKYAVKGGLTYIVVPATWLDQPVVNPKREWKSWTPEALLEHYGRRKENA